MLVFRSSVTSNQTLVMLATSNSSESCLEVFGGFTKIPSCGETVQPSWRSAFKSARDLVKVVISVKGGFGLITKTGR